MRVNEKSTVTFTVRPLNESGLAFIPTNARYKLNDLNSSTELIAWTALTPATEMTIVIPAGDNAIIDTSLAEEDKVLTVETDYGTDNAHNEESVYAVVNLTFVT